MDLSYDERAALIDEALETWAPSYPRRVNKRQREVTDGAFVADELLEAEGAADNEPFISVYSFPDGHTSNGAVPQIDTLFIDFDFENGEYQSGSGDREAWRRDLSHLLVRARMVAQTLVEQGSGSWRASLSGHKGIHLFHDFDPIDMTLGPKEQYAAGLDDYAEDVVDRITEETGVSDLDRYVDVTSSDMARLCRVPNTMHSTATRSFDEPRFCVPVTLDELAEMTVDEYEEMTKQPRPSPYHERVTNSDVTDAVERYISSATITSTYGGGSSTADYSLVAEYKEESNDNITFEDLQLLTSDRPCVWKFHEREDKWDYGMQSHYMELYCVRELVEHKVPIPVIKEFFERGPGDYYEQYTEQIIEGVIARDYNRFRTDTLLNRAPEFCGYDDCARCQRIMKEQNISIYD